jgi:hypothetical protein
MKSLPESDFPTLYLAADRGSQAGQRRFLTASRLRLLALAVAAIFGTVTVTAGRLDLAGIIGATALAAALVAEVYLLTVRPDRQWYDARAAAESAKTLTWRYLVGGQPFAKDESSEQEADRLLLGRFTEITGSLRGFALVPVSDGGHQITPAMRKIRGLPLDDRRSRYFTGRIGDQQAWYAARATWNERRAAQWSVTLASLEAAGLVAAVLKAAGAVGFDLAGIAGALAAGGVAWFQTRQHQALANAYAIAAQELAAIASRADWPVTEAEWAHFVDEAEEAISREHTLWCASRA